MSVTEVPATSAGGNEQAPPTARGWYWAEPRFGEGDGAGVLEVVFVYFVGPERIGAVCALPPCGARMTYRRVDEFRWYGPVLSAGVRDDAASTLDAVIHQQLRDGEASEGDPRDLQWCSEQVGVVLDLLNGGGEPHVAHAAPAETGDDAPDCSQLPAGFPAAWTLGAPELGFGAAAAKGVGNGG
jgi:hypothetical protein